jgi:hypothetical protein
LLSGFVARSVERYEAIYGSDEDRLADLIDELADWFCRDADPMFVVKSIVGFTAPGPLTIAPDVTVRRTTDEEVSAMLEMGALNVNWNPNPAQVSIMHVDEAARWVVALDYSRPRFSGASGPNPNDPTISKFEAAANDWLAVLRILTPANVRLGPTFTTQLVGGITSGGWSQGYGQPTMFAWHNPATITPDMRETFVTLAGSIRDGRADQVGIALGLHRFTEATTRTSAADRLVDLVIALESMFSKEGGAASYQLSRRASAVLGVLGLSAEAVYKFLSAAYYSRSKIVHGGNPKHKNLAGEPCRVDEQVAELDRLVAALFRQILASSSIDKPADFADKLISDALDSQRPAPTTDEPATYEVTVTHEGGRFSAVPPADSTSRVYGGTLEQLGTRLADVIAVDANSVRFRSTPLSTR